MGFVFLSSNRVERVLTSVIERTNSINQTHWKIPARLCAITEPIEQQSVRWGLIEFNWFLVRFVRLTTPDLYKESPEKRGVASIAPKTFLDNDMKLYICILFQFTQPGQVAVKYQRNVGSLSIDMSADNLTITLGRRIGQHIGRVGRHIDRCSTDTSRSTE